MKIEEQEDIIKTEKENWEGQKKALHIQAEDTKKEIIDLKKNISDLQEINLKITNQVEQNQLFNQEIQKKYIETCKENENLKQSNQKLNRENSIKDQMISDFEIKLNTYNNDFNLEITKHAEEVENFKKQLSELKNKLSLEG